MKQHKTRKTYLSALRWALMWRLPPREIQEVWEDYDGFFTAGLAEGKTEAELCEQFGPPREAARAIQEETPRGIKISRHAVLTGGLILAASLLYLYYCSDYFLRQSSYWAGCVSICFVPVLCLLWRGGGLQMPPLDRREGGRLAALHGLTLVLWLAPLSIYHFLMAAVARDDLTSLPKFLQKSANLGMFYTTIVGICRLLLLAILLVSLVLAWQRSARFFTVTAHGQAVLVSLTCVYQILTGMSLEGPTQLERLMVPPVLLYFIELVSVLLVILLLWREWRCIRRGRTA